MTRNLLIAFGVVGLVALVCVLLFREQPTARPDGAGSTEVAEGDSSPSFDARTELPPVEETPDPLADVLATADAQIDLEAGSSAIRGVVQDDEARAVPGAEVILFKTQLARLEREGGSGAWELIERDFTRGIELSPELTDAAEPIARLRASDDGTFEFIGVATGEYMVAGGTPGYLISPAQQLIFAEEGSQSDALVALTPAAQLHGRVVDASTRGVADARVAVSGEIIDMENMRRGGGYLTFQQVAILLLNAHELAQTTDAEGAFNFPRLPFLTYEIHVLAPPFAERSVRQALPHETEVEIVLEDGATLSGRVIQDNGRGVGGLTVSVRSEEGGRMARFTAMRRAREVVTERDGSFSVSGLIAGEVMVMVEGPGYLRETVSGVQASLDGTEPLEIIVRPGAVIAGRVTDEQGRALPDIQVRARELREDDGRFGRGGGRGGFGRGFFGGNPETTDSNGEFRFDRLEAGKYQLTLTGEGYARTEQEAETGQTDLKIRMEVGQSISGRVVDAEAAPIEGATVRVGNGWGRQNRVETDKEGRFELGGLDRGTLEVNVQSRGFLIHSFETEGGDLGDIVLEVAPRLIGVVVGPDGYPVAGARVSANALSEAELFNESGDEGRGGRRGRGGRGGGRGGREGWGPESRASAWSDAEGVFALELPAYDRTWRVRASATGFLDSEAAEFHVTRDTEGLRLTLGLAGEIVGRVTGVGGEPIAGAEVRLEPYRADDGEEGRGRGGRRGGGFGFGRGGTATRSEADGTYRLTGIMPGSYRIRASARTYANFTGDGMDLPEGAQRTFDIRLEAEKRLRGIVVDPSGQPIPDARIRVVGALSGMKRGSSGPAGRFEIGGLAADVLRLDVSHDEFSQTRLDEVFADAGELVVTLEPTYTVAGVVIDSVSGLPVERARIRVDRATSAEGAEDGEQRFGRRGGRPRRTDADGRFSVPGIEAGDWTVTVEADDYLAFTSEVLSIPDARVDALELIVVPGGRVNGVVRDTNGRPVANARVIARLATETGETVERGRGGTRVRPKTGRTDDEGRFEVGGLDTGKYTLSIDHDEYVPASIADVEVEIGARGKELRQTLEKGAEVAGVLTDSSGRRVEMRVRVVGGDPQTRKNASVTESGQYRAAGLPAGTYVISIYEGRSREPLHEETVELSSGQSRRLDIRLP